MLCRRGSNAGLGRGDMKFVEVNGVHRGNDRVVTRIVCKGYSTDMAWVPRNDSLVPGSTKLRETDGDRSKIGGIVIGTQLFIELEIFGDLSNVDRGAYRIFGIPHEITGRGNARESGMHDAGESRATSMRHKCSAEVSRSWGRMRIVEW